MNYSFTMTFNKGYVVLHGVREKISPVLIQFLVTLHQFVNTPYRIITNTIQPDNTASTCITHTKL